MSDEDLTDRLDAALDALLAVRVALGGGKVPRLPDEALDAALGLHQGYQEARRGFVAALEAVRRAGVTDEVVFTLEAAAHHLAAQAAEVGWSLRLTARGGGDAG